VARFTAGPARLFSLPGGRLSAGAPADITILDLERAWTVEPKRFLSRGRNTPFGGWTGVGAPVLTLVGGLPALPGGQPLAGPGGSA
jgi:dihydroorotase